MPISETSYRASTKEWILRFGPALALSLCALSTNASAQLFSVPKWLSNALSMESTQTAASRLPASHGRFAGSAEIDVKLTVFPGCVVATAPFLEVTCAEQVEFFADVSVPANGHGSTSLNTTQDQTVNSFTVEY